MNAKSQSCILTAIVGVVSFIAGLFIGLVVLGWFLFPVRWSGGDMTVVASPLQQDYLRAAIDSYTQNMDSALAEWRFKNLGASGPQTLGWIYANPDRQDPAQIQAYASTIGQEAALQNAPVVPPAPSTPQPAFGYTISTPILAAFCAILSLGGLCVLLILLIVRRNRRKAAQPAPETSEAIDLIPQPGLQEPLAVEQPATFDITQPAIEQTEQEAQPAEELPEWLQEIAPPSAETVRLEGEAAVEPFVEADAAAIRFEEFEDNTFGQPPSTDTLVLSGQQPEPQTFEKEELGKTPIASEQMPAVEEESIADESPEETQAKFGRNLETLKGIGAADGAKLKAAGITAPLLLLRKGATRQGRHEIAEKTGISEASILQWVNHVDLFRVRGIGPEYADLLEQAGVDTVTELATRNANNLHQKIVAANETEKLVHKPPTLAQVANWIDQARKLPRTITY